MGLLLRVGEGKEGEERGGVRGEGGRKRKGRGGDGEGEGGEDRPPKDISGYALGKGGNFGRGAIPST